RAAVHLGRQVHAVPVDGGGLGQAVGEAHLDLLATLRAQRRPEVVAVEPPRADSLTIDLRAALLGGQLEDAAAVLDGRLGQRWDGQLGVEVDLADGVDGGDVPGERADPGDEQHEGGGAQREHADEDGQGSVATAWHDGTPVLREVFPSTVLPCVCRQTGFAGPLRVGLRDRSGPSPRPGAVDRLTGWAPWQASTPTRGPRNLGATLGAC